MRYILAATMLFASVAQAGETVATRSVQAPVPGQVIILELSNNPPEPDVCGKGHFMGRLVLDTPEFPNRSYRINLGCWRFAPDAWGGRVKYSGWDEVNQKDIAIDLPTTAFTTTKAFKEWPDYSGL